MDVDATSAEAHKHTDAASYDAAAAAFDELTERYAAPLAERTLDLARLKPADRLLDLGTGTGLVALRAARRLGAGQVAGIDHSQGMLDQAEAKARKQGLGATISFRAMDAEALGFADGAFDAVVSLFVLRHLPDPAASAREVHRVLAPGGRFVAGVGASPALFSAQGAAAALRTISSRVAHARGRLLLAPDFLRALMIERGLWVDRHDAAHHHGIDVPAALRQAGFAHVEAIWSGLQADLEPEEFWAVQAVYGSAERVRLAELTTRQVADLKADFLARAQAVRARGGKLAYRYGAMFYTAVR